MILEAEIKVFDTRFRSLICCDCSDLAKADLTALCDLSYESP